MLITEALQQTKILTERIGKKQALVIKYVAISSLFADPLEKHGGSSKAVSSALASINALQKQLLQIKVAIEKANLSNILTVGDISQSVAEWIVWKRLIGPSIVEFSSLVGKTIVSARAKLEQEQSAANRLSASKDMNLKETKIIVHLNELELASINEKTASIIGQIDAKLSIFNATTQLDLTLAEID